jgi:ABC-type multidrug transport system ATPase subunit
VNSEPITADEMQRISGFVQQEDVILDTMTVREALIFSAMMRLPKEMSAVEKEQRALDVADLLGLTSTLDSLVGSSIIKGISGGEKRRWVSCAAAMLPTSCRDSDVIELRCCCDAAAIHAAGVCCCAHPGLQGR